MYWYRNSCIWTCLLVIALSFEILPMSRKIKLHYFAAHLPGMKRLNWLKYINKLVMKKTFVKKKQKLIETNNWIFYKKGAKHSSITQINREILGTISPKKLPNLFSCAICKKLYTNGKHAVLFEIKILHC